MKGGREGGRERERERKEEGMEREGRDADGMFCSVLLSDSQLSCSQESSCRP